MLWAGKGEAYAFFGQDGWFKRNWTKELGTLLGVLLWITVWSVSSEAVIQRPCGVLATEGQSKTVLVVGKKPRPFSFTPLTATK